MKSAPEWAFDLLPWGVLLPNKIDQLLVPVAMSSPPHCQDRIADGARLEQSRQVAHLDPEQLPKKLKTLTDPEV